MGLGAIGLVVLVWAPNLAWEATNGWPQITMASRIAGNAADNRAQIVPLLWLFTGPFLFPGDRRRPGVGARREGSRAMARGHVRARAVTFTAAAAFSGAPVALLTLPVLPLATYARTSLPSAVTDTTEQIGWRQLVATVEGVVPPCRLRSAATP